MINKKHYADQFSFVGGVAKRKGLVFILLSGDEAADAKTPFVLFSAWRDGEWLNAGEQDWLAAGITYIEEDREQLLAVGEFGDVFIRGGGKQSSEKIVKGDGGPSDRGPLRCVRRIGDSIYVVGMDRQAYVRAAGGKWRSIDAGAKPRKGSTDVVGFESVDGFGASELYAAGWEGEIWRFDGKKWARKDSPTDTILTAVCCGGNGLVYIGGRKGTLIQGRDDEWTVIELPDLRDDLWDLAWFKEALYLATTTGLYRYQNGELKYVNFGEDEPKTFLKLSVGDGELWSIGAKDVMRFDGKNWERIE